MKVAIGVSCLLVIAAGIACSSQGDTFKSTGDSGGTTGSSGGEKGEGSNAGGESMGGQSTGGQGADVVSLADLGDTCEAESECDSGYCVDGVCCEEACDGECQECGGDGICDVTPRVDLDHCATLSCPEDSTCQSWRGGVEAGACAEFGMCAEEHSCDAVPSSRGTACAGISDGQVCDGEGTCGHPQLSCGSVTCSSEGTEFCCYERKATTSANNYSCATSEQACTTNLNAGWRAHRISCAGSRDCENGDVCCLHVEPVTAGTDSAYCTSAAICDDATYDRRVCDRNADCEAGQECKAATGGSPIRTCGTI